MTATPAKTEPHRSAIAFAMKRYGGNFMKAMGEALLRADPANAAKIKAAWPDEWAEYAEFARTTAE